VGQPSPGTAVILSDITWLAPYGRPVSLALVVLVITYLSLIVGELVPNGWP
jgi:putative hemolysin